jgi:hypothetical protein
LTEEPALRVPAAMELGALVRDKLGDDKKAITVFERCSRWTRTAWTRSTRSPTSTRRSATTSGSAYANEKLLERESDPDERRVLMLQIAALYETHLDDAARSFEWYRRATSRRRTPRGCSWSIRPPSGTGCSRS